MKKQDLSTKQTNTWCPGCPNNMILESVKKAVAASGFKQTDFAITTDIGCNSKIYDYLNLSGIYGLHGRSVVTGLGIKLGNPKLKRITLHTFRHWKALELEILSASLTEIIMELVERGAGFSTNLIG